MLDGQHRRKFLNYPPSSIVLALTSLHSELHKEKYVLSFSSVTRYYLTIDIHDLSVLLVKKKLVYLHHPLLCYEMAFLLLKGVFTITKSSARHVCRTISLLAFLVPMLCLHGQFYIQLSQFQHVHLDLL